MSLSLCHLPRFDLEANRAVFRAFLDRPFQWDAPVRRAHASWLTWGLEKQWIDGARIDAAFGSATPWRDLTGCVQHVTDGLTRHLNARFDAALGGCASEGDGLYLSYDIYDDGRPVVALSMDQPQQQSVNSLHCIDPAVAALVYDTLKVIEGACLNCLLPGDIRSGGFSWYDEDLFLMLDEIAAQPGALNEQTLLAAFEHDTDSDAAYAFEDWRDDCDGLLRLHALTQPANSPAWMTANGSPPTFAASHYPALRRRLSAMEARSVGDAEALWLGYVAAALGHLTPFVRQPLVRSQHGERYLDYDGEGQPLGVGWAVLSDPLEGHLLERFFQHINEIGEYPQDRFIAAAPDEGLLALLEAVVTGCGLLLRVDRTNEAVRDLPRELFAFEEDAH